MPSMATYKTKHWVPVRSTHRWFARWMRIASRAPSCWSFGATRTAPPDWAGPDTMGVKYADGAEVFYNTKDHKLTVNAPDSELSITCKKLK